ncbi:MAG TPA: GxxExxY protein [Anaerolineales bacterium]|nr:GxxExxY protein [Anaerolineales bacterium]
MHQFGTGQKPIFQGKHPELSDKIIKIFYEVHNELGYGFSEKIYLKAFKIALQAIGLKVDDRVPINVYFRGQLISELYADLIVSDLIMLELKSVSQIIDEHEAQLLNYLKSTKIEVGYVMNFGKSATFKRKVFDNDRKGSLNWTKE